VAARGSKGDRFHWVQEPTLAIALLVCVVGGGTLGYVLIEGWNAWDALYMTMMTLTTVGYGEVHPLSRAGQVFTVLLMAGGVGLALYVFTLAAGFVVQGGLLLQLNARRRRRMLETLRDHFIICGYGRIGSVVLRELQRQNVPCVVIERDPERVHEVIEAGGLAVEADASREEVLKRVGIERARGFIAAVGTDAENVYAVLSARLMRPDLFIIGRAETVDAERKLRRAGADRVISPYRIGAQQMAQTALRPAVVDFVELATSSENLELAMEQVTIDGASSLEGRSILETNMRQRFGVIVVGIRRKDGRMEFNPEPDSIMRGGDQLVVLGRPASLKELENAAQTRVSA
jgi:voltage-gated potassium channel